MKAVWFEDSGPAADVLRFGDRDTPVPGAGEVLVRLHASSVNPSDVKKRAGAQPAGLEQGFVIPHSDGAGVIEAVGGGVGAERKGQRVWVYQAQFQRHLGTAAQYVVVPGERAAPLPEAASFQVGACAGIPMMTAHRCVALGPDIAGQTLLVTGASGRVGFYVAQMARLKGARVIGTAGSESRCADASRAGCDLVLNYREDGLVEAINEFTAGAGVDRVIDVEFGANIDTSRQVLKVNGHLVTYSSSQMPEPAIPFYPLMFSNISINLVLVYNMPEPAKQSAIEEINAWLASDSLVHRIAAAYPLADTVAAHEAIEAGGLDGCVVIDID